MSDIVLSFLIALAILAAMFAFVPLLDLCNARCRRLFLRRPRQSPQPQASQQTQPDLRAAA